jgi:glycine/D-amino acid oxidase-like deaminating enzyme
MAGNVSRIAPLGARVAIYLEDGHSIEADCVVVAAGVWTRELLRGLGVRLLLDAHRGYNVSTIDKAVDLTHPLIWEEQGVGFTPMQGGLRAAGTVEIVGLSTPPNPRRPEQIRQLLSKAVTNVDLTGCKTWMGSRPMTPDTLPIIGAIAGHPNIYAATGHGHLGLSMAAVTGRIVADLVSTGRTEIDVAALSPNRFSH